MPGQVHAVGWPEAGILGEAATGVGGPVGVELVAGAGAVVGRGVAAWVEGGLVVAEQALAAMAMVMVCLEAPAGRNVGWMAAS